MSERKGNNKKTPKSMDELPEITDASPDLSKLSSFNADSLYSDITSTTASADYLYKESSEIDVYLFSHFLYLPAYGFERDFAQKLNMLVSNRKYDKARQLLEEYLDNNDVIRITNSGKPWTYYARFIASKIYRNLGKEATFDYWSALLEYFDNFLIPKRGRECRINGKIARHLHRGHIFWELGALSFREAYAHEEIDDDSVLKGLKKASSYFEKGMYDNKLLEKNYENAPRSDQTSSYTKLAITEVLIELKKGSRDHKKKSKGEEPKAKEDGFLFDNILREAFNLEIVLTKDFEIILERNAEIGIKKYLSNRAITKLRLMDFKDELDSITKQGKLFPLATVTLCYSLLEGVKHGRNNYPLEDGTIKRHDSKFDNFLMLIERFRNRIHPVKQTETMKITSRIARILKILTYRMLADLGN